MNNLSASVMQDIEDSSYALAQQAIELFQEWKAGKYYIPKPALRAMGRRYLKLRDKEVMSLAEVYEFGRLYAFFCLVYPDGDLPSPADIAVDFYNVLACGLPISATISSGAGDVM